MLIIDQGNAGIEIFIPRKNINRIHSATPPLYTESTIRILACTTANFAGIPHIVNQTHDYSFLFNSFTAMTFRTQKDNMD
jgi:hypothetical protein